MLTGELHSQTIPYLHLNDKVEDALLLMNDNQVAHLPVVEDGKLLGVLSEDNLLEADNEDATLNQLQPLFVQAAVKNTEHFLKALQIAGENNLSLVPIIDEENHIQGVIAYGDLLRYAADFMSLNEPGGLIVLEVDTNQYSFNEISKLVETNDAQITQLNTSNNAETGKMQVTIRINKPEISDIVATFQRYEYNVKYYLGEELYTNELRDNYDNLMNYLKV
ncbi:MAG: CBS domain-containing protein [Chitinophagaceae bacterium]|nr:CBS domain-containing protein [Chitinophagaceae bacterium]